MAAEYSRELSAKVFAGQKRICEAGFRLGSSPGYGLRRMLVSSYGKLKHQLAPREWKSITTDCVILVPGPKDEVDTVREIYRLLIEKGMTVFGIACDLNRRSVKYQGNARWSNHAVYRILTGPKYAGFSVFGRTSQKLGTHSVHRAPAEWIMAPNAFAPIVDHRTFIAAQQVLAARTLSNTKEYLLSRLRTLLASEGRLSHEIITTSTITPSPNAYIKQFGNLTHTYELVGAKMMRQPGNRELHSRLRSLRHTLIAQLLSKFPCRVSVIKGVTHTQREQLTVDNLTTVSVSLARALQKKTTIRWRYDAVSREYGNFILLARLTEDNQSLKDFVLFPPETLTSAMNLKLNDARLAQGVLFDNLERFPEMLNRIVSSIA